MEIMPCNKEQKVFEKEKSKETMNKTTELRHIHPPTHAHTN